MNSYCLFKLNEKYLQHFMIRRHGMILFHPDSNICCIVIRPFVFMRFAGYSKQVLPTNFLVQRLNSVGVLVKFALLKQKSFIICTLTMPA